MGNEPALAPYSASNPDWYIQDGQQLEYSGRIEAGAISLVAQVLLTLFPADGSTSPALDASLAAMDRYCATHRFDTQPSPAPSLDLELCTPTSPAPAGP